MTQINKLPSTSSPSPWQWLQTNLFSTWYNVILTIICLVAIVQGSIGFFSWAFTIAEWGIIGANLPLLMVGRFPPELYWRVWLSVTIIAGLAGLTWGFYQGKTNPWNRTLLFVVATAVAAALLVPLGLNSRLWIVALIVAAIVGVWAGRNLLIPKISVLLPLSWFIAAFVIFWLLKGGFGLEPVRAASQWQGLLLTMVAAVVSIVLSFPLGVLLALGRQSSLPVVRGLSVFYIEVIRGLPLIVILFFSQVMLKFFLPPEFPELDEVMRAIAGLTLFSAAYLAENVRGGLQSIPRGQIEAASALGLSTPLVISLIVLPQALKAVIPAIVGQFIGLFKDTSLLAVSSSLLELTGISRTILAQPQFIGDYAEIYLFIGLIYWGFCYGMSLASRRLEKFLNVGEH